MRPADTGRQKDRTYAEEDRLYRVYFFLLQIEQTWTNQCSSEMCGVSRNIMSEYDVSISTRKHTVFAVLNKQQNTYLRGCQSFLFFFFPSTCNIERA